MPKPLVTATEYRYAAKVEILSALNPVSLQAPSARKIAFKTAVADAVAADTTGIFSGDVEVTLEWFISEKDRYDTHIVADIDNVVKPLLDAITGPSGILIDDNQVQSLRIWWLTPGPEDLAFRLRIDAHDKQQLIDRADLCFVKFSNSFCFPLFGGVSKHAALMVKVIEQQIKARDESLAIGVSEYDANMVMSIQRGFPSARLGRFTVYTVEELKTMFDEQGWGDRLNS